MTKIVMPVGGPSLPPTPQQELTELKIGNDTYKLNANGEAVDDTGKVIKTKEEIEKLKNPNPNPNPPTPPTKTPEQEAAEKLAARTTEITNSLVEGAEVELDGEKHVLDKDGNIVKDGKVLKTKAELITYLLTQADEEPETNYISELQKITNFTPLTDSNQPIEYENTLAGIGQYIQDLQRTSIELGGTNFEKQLFTKFPILQDVINHLTLHGGSLDGYNPGIDYSTITIKDEDEAQHIELFTAAKAAQGVPKNEIDDLIKYYKEDKKLKDAAVTALTYLKTTQETNKATNAAAVAAARKREEDAQTAYWNEVNGILTSKKLVVDNNTFTIPEVIRIKTADGKVINATINDFKEYIEKPKLFVINNQQYQMTQLEYDEYIEDTKRTPHKDLFDAYRKFTKYDDSQLISAAARTEGTKKILKINSKSSSGGSGSDSKKFILPIK